MVVSNSTAYAFTNTERLRHYNKKVERHVLGHWDKPKQKTNFRRLAFIKEKHK